MDLDRTTICCYRTSSAQRGISLIELLISVVIGLIIVAGVWTLLVNSRSSFNTSQNQAYMLDTGRFALHTIGQDLRMAGGFGRTNWSQGINTAGVPPASDDCAAGFYVDVNRKVFGIDDATAYNSPCISAAERAPNSDILVVRYADPVVATDVEAGDAANSFTPFVQTYLGQGQIFIGGNAGAVPAIFPNNNARLITNVYYINVDTEAGDGIPSLRKISIEPGVAGPEMQDRVLVSGVEEFHVQFGINDCTALPCASSVNRYVNADNPFFGGANWGSLAAARQVEAVRIWLLVRSETIEAGLNTADSFVMAGRTVNTPNDQFRRSLYSSVFSLRNAGDRARRINGS